MVTPFRPLESDADRDAWADLLVEAFAIPDERVRDFTRGVAAGEALVATGAAAGDPGDERVIGGLGFAPASQRWGGRDVPVDGVSAVCVALEHRGRGVSSGLVRAALEASRARGRPLAILYPSTVGHYRKAGYEVAGAVYRMRLRLAALPRTPAPGVTVRPLSRAEIEAAARDDNAAQGNLVARSAFFWRRAFRDGARGVGLVADGRLVGGAVLVRSQADHGHDVELKRWWADDDRAVAALLALLAQEGAVGRYARWLGAPTDRLVMALPAEIWELEAAQPWMLRVVDLAAAFEARGYPEGLTARVALAVEDPVCPWNDGAWELTVAGGRARATRLREAPGDALRLDARGLARLFAGVTPHDHGLCAGPQAWLDEAF